MYLGLFATASDPAPPPPATAATVAPARAHGVLRSLIGEGLHSVHGGSGGMGGGIQGLIAFLGALAVVPSTLNFLGSLLINHVSN